MLRSFRASTIGGSRETRMVQIFIKLRHFESLQSSHSDHSLSVSLSSLSKYHLHQCIYKKSSVFNEIMQIKPSESSFTFLRCWSIVLLMTLGRLLRSGSSCGDEICVFFKSILSTCRISWNSERSIFEAVWHRQCYWKKIRLCHLPGAKFADLDYKFR